MSAEAIKQLMEMGASRAQAQAALKNTKDIMQAASDIFSGRYDKAVEEPDATDTGSSSASAMGSSRTKTPDVNEDEDADELMDEDEAEEDDDEDGGDYYDYDSDSEGVTGGQSVDPYAGIFFSKDRREEVVEVEETPETFEVDNTVLPIMTQGEWMKGCPEGNEQSLLYQLYSQLSDPTCPCANHCGHSAKRQKSFALGIYPNFDDYLIRFRAYIQYTCPSCRTEFCLVCGDRVDPRKASLPSYDPLFHCPDTQAVVLGIGLSQIEHTYFEQFSTSSSSLATPGDSKKRKSADPDDPDDDEPLTLGTGKKKLKGGIGYAGVAKEDMSGQLEALANQKKRDDHLGQLLKSVRAFLPNVNREGGGHPGDYLPHPSTLAHLRRRFNLVSSNLLRNDSLSDMSDRAIVYFELFEWLQTIANHEALASMMAMPIMSIFSSTPFTRTPSSSSTSSAKREPGPRQRTIVYEGSSGPRELMESIVIQAQAAVKGLQMIQAAKSKEMTEEEKRVTKDTKEKMDAKGKGRATLNEDNVKLKTFCERIINTSEAIDRALTENKGADFVKRMRASLPKIRSKAHVVSSSSKKSFMGVEDTASVYFAADSLITEYDDVPVGATEEETEKNYVQWASSVRFEYCDLTIEPESSTNTPNAPTPDKELETPSYKHHFNAEIRQLANADVPKRNLAIAKELAVLTTNLPISWDSSVFLRVDETRVDVIKALIIGPEGSPYQNGIFLFDIFLGASYNQGPPLVKYMSTFGGKYRFNPNLYADGKVCLSLLGTWQGPGWIPGKSTLLQVLISIQSMILCAEPYLNEPGWATEVGTPASRAYSANVRRMTVHAGMLEAVKRPSEPFADIIRTHFRLKEKSINKQLDEWLAQDDGRPVDGGNHGTGGQTDGKGPGGKKNGLLAWVTELRAVMKALNSPKGKGIVVNVPQVR